MKCDITCGVIGLLACSSLALASGVPVGHVHLQDSYGTTAGGEFRAIAQADFTFTPGRTGTNFQGGIAAAPGLFETFCVEKFETISLGTIYNTFLNTTTQSSNSNYNAGAHGGSADPLDSKTAYLYTHFINRNLTTSYDYVNGTNRASDANALQTAIWYIEQEDTTPLSGKALQLYNEASAAVSSGAWSGIGEVRVLNFVTSGGADAQDQLVLQPSNLIAVPLPVPGAMGVAGLLGVAALRRRR